MKKEILIYENDREILKFLRSFFRKRNDYRTRFITRKDIDNLRGELERKKPDALIIGNTTKEIRMETIGRLNPLVSVPLR